MTRDLKLALASLSYISSPLNVGEAEILKQKATDIQRCRCVKMYRKPRNF